MYIYLWWLNSFNCSQLTLYAKISGHTKTKRANTFDKDSNFYLCMQCISSTPIVIHLLLIVSQVLWFVYVLHWNDEFFNWKLPEWKIFFLKILHFHFLPTNWPLYKHSCSNWHNTHLMIHIVTKPQHKASFSTCPY